MNQRNYQVVRFGFKEGRRVVKSNMTEDEAIQMCRDPETSGSTCSNLNRRGQWFCGVEKMPRKKKNRRKANTNRLGQSLKKCYFG